MAQGPSDTILVAIWITLRIRDDRESKVRNPDPPDRRRFVLSEHSFLVTQCQNHSRKNAIYGEASAIIAPTSSCRFSAKISLRQSFHVRVIVLSHWPHVEQQVATHFPANDVICSLLLRATQTCCRTCGQCESTITRVRIAFSRASHSRADHSDHAGRAVALGR